MFTTLEHCLIIQLIPNLSMNFSMFLMFAIGVDRLLSICNPFRYKQMNRVAYVTTMTTAAIFYASTLLVITVHSGIEDRNNDVICIIAAVYTGAAKYIWAAAGCTLNLTIIVMYVVVWIIVKRKPGAHANGNAEQHISGGGQWRKLFRSITIAALLVVFGWFATMSAYAVSLATHRTPLQLHCMTILAGIFVNSSIACNYFVFFTFSPEYRRAFLEHLNYLCGCIHFEVVATRLNLSTRSTDRKQKKPTITGRRKTHHIHSEALLEERIGTSQNERRIAVRRSLSND
ncbi:hypothetical protein Tcan_18898 [Toxocara canis]|uniref:G-protein coupled receptors family 1 profile domain-containing protein n=1 Tax=Toxocara canis TaxID=6265 RepID=A0A0B2VW12_TOXCA|nr:hypothetical protein Tcan_18898 [Toxocara canis]